MSNSLNYYPLVSVGVPVFNEEKYIEEMLISIQRQKYSNLEVLISDNASTDGTWDIISEVTKADCRFRAVRQNINKGAEYNFWYVLNAARGQFFIWAGGHDVWGPDMINELVLTFEKNIGAVLCIPRTKWIDNKGNFLFEKEVLMDTRSATTPAGRVLLFLNQRERCNAVYGLHRREVLLSTWPWPNGSDFIGLLRIASLGDILTNKRVYWCRRVVRSETISQKTERHKEYLQYSGFVAKFPHLIDTLTMLLEVAKIDGRLDRLRLISHFLRHVTFQPARIKLLITEAKKNFFTKQRVVKKSS